MEDQLITFKTAKLAKEKGFDFRVFNSYNEEEIIEQDNQELMYELFANRHLPKGSISAPTQSLLQRWLREKHKLYILINYLSKEQFNWEINMFQHGEYGIGFRGTYEEALEKGLYQALKLI